ncbi:MAG: xanthine dehydrogenase accessory protein XdhC [Deltaproteobacteria bacterium]|nr:xanthine dehydrogenase accessory protein XdhC [Deltaproteobacteria bacterium]
MNRNFWKILAHHADHGPKIALVSIIGHKGSTPQGTGNKMLIHLDGSITGTIGGGALEYKVIQLAKKSLTINSNIRTEFNLTYDLGMCCGGIVEVFIEIIHPTDQLVIYGAGHVGMALANLAVQLDYNVTLIDPRIDFAHPQSQINYLEQNPLSVIKDLPFGMHCDHFITTHEHLLDQNILLAIKEKPIRYLGMIGSKTKKLKFQMRFSAGDYKTEVFNRLHTPAGLDIQAQSPMEIAVSIAAELIKTRRIDIPKDHPHQSKVIKD